MSPLNENQMSTTAKGTLPENENCGISFYDELEVDFDVANEDVKPDIREGSVDPKDGKWDGKRGSNKPPTQGVQGTGTNPKNVK